jgi:hypothetical protein
VLVNVSEERRKYRFPINFTPLGYRASMNLHDVQSRCLVRERNFDFPVKKCTMDLIWQKKSAGRDSHSERKSEQRFALFPRD